MKVALVIGAGVDKTNGINMPLVAELVPRIRTFLNNEGKEVEAALRKMLPGLRFKYDNIIKNAVEKLATDFKTQVQEIRTNIESELNNENLSESDKNLGELIFNLLDKIQRLTEDTKIDQKTEELINIVFENKIEVSEDNIINLDKLSFTDVFSKVMNIILEKSLEDPQNPILKHIHKSLMDFERLLMNSFVGFYTGRQSEMKKYLYLSWTLWAYLSFLQINVLNNINPIPFYSTIPKEWNIVTLNYTRFARDVNPNAKYFHGDLTSFIDMTNRTVGKIELNNDPDGIAQFLLNTISKNINFDSKNTKCVIPSIIPPLKLKPVLSKDYITIWYESKSILDQSELIVVIGYSFAKADEHFNDLIRSNKHKKIVIIDPNADVITNSIQHIFTARKEDFIQNLHQGKESFSHGNLILIKSLAADIELSKLTTLFS